MLLTRSGALDGLLKLIAETPDMFSEIHYTQAGFHLLETMDGERGRNIVRSIGMTELVDPTHFRTIGVRADAVAIYLEALNRHTPVVWVGPRIEPHIMQQALLRFGCAHDYALRPGQREVFEQLDHTLAATAKDSGLSYSSQINGMTFDISKDFMTCDTLYWSDGDHWTQAGAARFVRRLIVEQVLVLP